MKQIHVNKINKSYSFPRLKWPKTEGRCSRPFVGQNWFRLVFPNRINTADVIGYFFLTNRVLFLCPTYTHPIRSFQGISSRPFIGENVFWSVPQNRMSTENAVGCLFLSLTLTFYCFHKFAVPHAAFCSKRPNRISHGSNSDFFWIWHVFWTLSIGWFSIWPWSIDQRQCSQVFDMQIHKYTNTNTQILKYSLGQSCIYA